MVYDIFRTVKIPIIGIGGIMNWRDVAEFFLVGASAVQVGTANFVNPEIPLKIVDELEKYLKEKDIASVNELKGGIQI
jgi:dihydroorotate dehydrogenase (NAD+) catalytic subunit